MDTKSFEEVPVGTLANGSDLILPIHRIIGKKPGPRLGMVALLHGDEILPNVIFQKLYQELDPAQLSGEVVLLPVANPLAYEALTRHTPLDMTNLNRVFPGSPGGWLTEQIAQVIVTNFLPRIDYLLDWHAGGSFPTVDYVFLSRGKPSMTAAFGCPYVYDTPGIDGSLCRYAEEHGIPGMIIEIGGGGLLDKQYIGRGFEGTLGVMQHLAMLEGEPVLANNPIVFKELVTLRPRAAGMHYPEVGLDMLGKVVPRGTLLGRTYSPYTFRELERFEAQFDQSLIVLLRGTVTRVNAGDYTYMLANAAVSKSH